MSDSRLIVVSNRLPLTLENKNGTWTATASSGGLATAMEPILSKSGGLWIGWTGDDGTLPPDERERLLKSSASEFSYVAVDFPPGEGKKFYEGYPNQTVWPLFHFFPSRMSFDPDAWRDYEAGNERFASTVSGKVGPGDRVWIHDYHLMLTPGLLRRAEKQASIGFFLHIPFPPSEIFSMLPHGDEVLTGLLGADLIAFHTHRHLHHFRSSLLRVLGVESTMQSVEYEGRTVRLEAMPIGIDPGPFLEMLSGEGEAVDRVRELKARYSGMRLLISVDRLDYSKGIPERLRTFARVLRNSPELRGQVVLMQVAVPSREGIEEYQSLSREINELAGEINGKYGTADWTPIMYLRHGIDRAELAALYAVSEVGWVTPLRDGMNLVAKEYCACKPNGDGVLVLSQFAGAAAEMGEALLVNPYDEEEVEEAILRALTMQPDERAERMSRLRERVIRHDVFNWAERFLAALESAGTEVRAETRQLEKGVVIKAFRLAPHRTLIFDYDGTLVPLADDPARTAPSQQLIAVLTGLAANRSNTVAVLSGRRTAELDKWLGAIPNLILGAEHGALIRDAQGSGWRPLSKPADSLAWKATVLPMLEQYADRAPGSFVEQKEFSLVWHYRRVEPEFGEWMAGELTALLEGLLAETEARPVRGKKIVEVRPVWATKGVFAADLLANAVPGEFQLAAGDDSTDEDVFEKMDPTAFTIRVGFGHSRARYCVNSPEAILNLLTELAQA